MSGETDLAKLLEGLDPVLDPQIYVFVSLAKPSDFLDLDPIMLFRESEGVTGIIPRSSADREDVSFDFSCQRITLQIHSSLEAVGLMAAVSAALKEAGIPANAVSAAHHDHIFVPEDKAEEALGVLQALSAASDEDMLSDEAVLEVGSDEDDTSETEAVIIPAAPQAGLASEDAVEDAEPPSEERESAEAETSESTSEDQAASEDDREESAEAPQPEPAPTPTPSRGGLSFMTGRKKSASNSDEEPVTPAPTSAEAEENAEPNSDPVEDRAKKQS